MTYHLFSLICFREDANLTWFDKHAVRLPARKVPLAADAPVVLAAALVQLDADPLARSERCLADEPHRSLARRH